MNSLKKILTFFLFIVLVILIILIIISTTKNCEAFKNASVSITPDSKGLYLQNLNNKLLILSNVQTNNKFMIDGNFIQMDNFYLDFQRVHLIQTVYLVFLRVSKNQVQHKWFFEKESSQNYYLYQVIKKQKIYLNIDQNTLIGSSPKKTLFIIN
jgi:hypothetical protein